MLSKFEKYVRTKGIKTLAEELGVQPCSVRVWLRREHIPVPKVIVKLVIGSNGKITVNDIYAHITQGQTNAK